MIPQSEWRWFGSPGHLIVSHDCRFHLCTLVGDVLVSTVGEWLPDSSSWDIYAKKRGITLKGRGDERRADFLDRVGYIELGYERKYETMAFRAGEPCLVPDCGCGLPSISGSELTTRAANDAGTATSQHYEVCFLASEQPIRMDEYGYEDESIDRDVSSAPPTPSGVGVPDDGLISEEEQAVIDAKADSWDDEPWDVVKARLDQERVEDSPEAVEQTFPIAQVCPHCAEPVEIQTESGLVWVQGRSDDSNGASNEGLMETSHHGDASNESEGDAGNWPLTDPDFDEPVGDAPTDQFGHKADAQGVAVYDPECDVCRDLKRSGMKMPGHESTHDTAHDGERAVSGPSGIASQEGRVGVAPQSPTNPGRTSPSSDVEPGTDACRSCGKPADVIVSCDLTGLYCSRCADQLGVPPAYKTPITKPGRFKKLGRAVGQAVADYINREELALEALDDVPTDAYERSRCGRSIQVIVGNDQATVDFYKCDLSKGHGGMCAIQVDDPRPGVSASPRPLVVQLSGSCTSCAKGEHEDCIWRGTPARDAHCECPCLAGWTPPGSAGAGPTKRPLDGGARRLVTKALWHLGRDPVISNECDHAVKVLMEALALREEGENA